MGKIFKIEKREIEKTDFEKLNDVLKIQNITYDLMKEFVKMEEELLVKVFEQYTGEKFGEKTPEEQGGRITIGIYENEIENYKLGIDGEFIGEVRRDFMKAKIDFVPFSKTVAITEKGVELRS